MIKVYNSDLELEAILNNAFNIAYSQKLNMIHTASFSLPYNDPKLEYCISFNFVEIFDGDERIDMFRINPQNIVKNKSQNIVTFQCEHVLVTLLDDVIFGYNLVADTNDTSDVIENILTYQPVTNWELNNCDFTENYQYKLENTNCLNALFNVPKMFTTDFQFTWDTTTYPWQLNLIETPSTPTSRIVYHRNLQSIEKKTDPSQLFTRIYGLGAGDGVNQIKLASDYIDSSNTAVYGIISRIWTDTNILTVDELTAKCQALLDENDSPRITYNVSAVDLYKITGLTLDKFVLGNIVQVQDEELNINVEAKITDITKSNLTNNPGDIQLQISNRVGKFEDLISNLQQKTFNTDVLLKGSTCVDSLSIQENCDNTYSGKLEFFLSDEVVFVNKCILNYKIEKYRAYSKSNVADPGMSSNSIGSTYNTSQGYMGVGFTTPWDGVTLPHVHYMADHAHTVPSHNHSINYGIYQFAYDPPSITLKVDGTTVSGVTGLTGTDIDIMSYLSKTGDNVNRSTFHTIEIIPNVDTNNPNGLCRIVANVNWKVFIRGNSGVIA